MSVTMATVLALSMCDFHYLFKISFSNELQILSGDGGGGIGSGGAIVLW